MVYHGTILMIQYAMSFDHVVSLMSGQKAVVFFNHTIIQYD